MFKKITASLLAITMVLGAGAQLTGRVLPDTAMSVSAAELTYGDYNYTILGDGTVEITNYSGDGVGKLVIPDKIDGKNVTSIGDGAFCWHGELTEVTIPATVTRIGDRAFIYDGELGKINIPDGVKYIGEGAFYGCSSLTEINIPNGVTTIAANAFYACGDLKKINIPKSVTEIGAHAFSSTKWIEDRINADPLVVVNNILIDGSACSGKVKIPNGVTTITDCAFESCEDMTEISIPNSVKLIKYAAFYNCTGLTELSIPGSVKTIETEAFQYCKSLKKLTIADGVKSIGEFAFSDCADLKSVTIPASVNNIEKMALGYYYDRTTEQMEKVSGFTINGVKGTAGESYAKENGFKCVLSEGGATVKGDIDGDDLVDAGDIVKIAAHVKGISKLSAEESARADLNGDGKVDIDDILLLAAHIKGIQKL